MKTNKLKTVQLPSFGSVTGLIFDRGGSAEIIMDGLEVMRVLEVWKEHEEGKKKPDQRVLAALNLLSPKARGLDLRLVAEVPIAQKRAKLTPVL
jgi:hypothetical protein